MPNGAADHGNDGRRRIVHCLKHAGKPLSRDLSKFYAEPRSSDSPGSPRPDRASTMNGAGLCSPEAVQEDGRRCKASERGNVPCRGLLAGSRLIRG